MREPLKTSRLLLRDILESDAQALFDLDSDPEVLRYAGRRPAADVAAYRERTRTVYLPMQAHLWQGVRVVQDLDSGDFLGWVFVRPATASPVAVELGWDDPGEVEIGYRLRRSAWGRGIASEAAGALLQQALADPTTVAVVACAESGNLASLRVLDKLGLRRVGERALADQEVVMVKLSTAPAAGDAGSAGQGC
jgi:RimJ/RimL family protein N-acetyltransferase